MSSRANIDSLAGRHFVSKSGNVAYVRRLAHGAIRVDWDDFPQSAEDEAEFVAWAESVLGVDLNPTHHRSNDKRLEAEAVRRWQREQR